MFEQQPKTRSWTWRIIFPVRRPRLCSILPPGRNLKLSQFLPVMRAPSSIQRHSDVSG